jgi:hypothetical protein
MTYQSPRIYIYKITFEEVPYYYYGVKKEKYFNEEYWGSPTTNKWCWELYTPKKQILELFDYNDDGWLKAQEVEKRLIRPFFNTDKWCLNESCGAIISMEAKRKSGMYCFENKIGIHAYTSEERKEIGRRNGIKNYKNKVGIHALTTEQRKEQGSKNGKKCKKSGTGIFSQSKEQLSENGKKGAQKVKQLGLGIHSLTPEQRLENSKKGASVINSQKWKCTETGYVSTLAGLSTYQKKRGIDTSKKIRVS